MHLGHVLAPVSRYNEAKDVAKNLEKQASKVQAEAEEAGDKALKIFANLTSLPPINTDALEVTPAGRFCSRALFARLMQMCF